MKILLIDNQTRHLQEIKNGLAGHQFTVVNYLPDVEIDDAGHDLVILTGGGGQGSEVNDTVDYRGTLWYQKEIDFIHRTKLPVMGICMGFEVIARAYGETIDKIGYRVRDFQHLTPKGKGRKTFGDNHIRQFESHEWRLKDIRNGKLEPLADSQWGVESFRVKNRPVLASQFHPEVVGGTNSIADMVSNTLKLQKVSLK